MSEDNSSGGGIGFTGALTLLFIGLKLGNVIDWSWWWVLCPLWIGAAIVVAIAIALLGSASFAVFVMWLFENRRWR